MDNVRYFQGVAFNSLVIRVWIAIDAVYVVGFVEGIAAPAAFAFVIAAKEHHADVDAAFAGGNDARTKPFKVTFVKFSEVEFRFSIQCQAGAGALPGERRRVKFAFAVA